MAKLMSTHGHLINKAIRLSMGSRGATAICTDLSPGPESATHAIVPEVVSIVSS